MASLRGKEDRDARKRNTYGAVQQFLGNLSKDGVECEIVALSDYRIETCRGCCSCFTRGEEHCPLKDDRDALIGKIEAADGVVFATPNYSFQVSGLMKVFLDRLGFIFHRPRFFGKTFTSIVCQGIYGGGKIVKYLGFVGGGLGFRTVKGSCLRTIEPITEKAWVKIERTLGAQSRRFAKSLAGPAFPAPSRRADSSIGWRGAWREARKRRARHSNDEATRRGQREGRHPLRLPRRVTTSGYIGWMGWK